jgi:hypothetical protein
MKIDFDLVEEYINGERWFDFCDVVVEAGIKRDSNGNNIGREMFKRIDGLDNLEKKNCIVFCKTDFLFDIFPIIGRSPYNHIVISFNSDYHITEKYYNAKPDNVKMWFAENVDYMKPDLIPLPLGMERYYGGGHSHDVNILNDRLQKTRNIKNLVYMNFSVNHHPSRKVWSDFMADKRYVTNHTGRGLSFTDYIGDLYDHSFCLSPIGNCIDCHRTYESIYMGCIPVVPRSNLIESLYDLPILIVDDINDLTEEYLLGKLDEFENTKFNYDKVRFHYWKNKIEELRDSL